MPADSMSMIIMMVVMIGVFYFFLIRPENKKKKAMNEMRNSLKVGDNITTIGGVVGRIVKIDTDTIIIETSEDRVRMEFAKWAVSTVGVQKKIEDTNNDKKNRKNQTPEERAEAFGVDEEEESK